MLDAVERYWELVMDERSNAHIDDCLRRVAAEIRSETMQECAQVCHDLPVDKERCRKLNLPEQAWEEAQEQCENAIRARMKEVT